MREDCKLDENELCLIKKVNPKLYDLIIANRIIEKERHRKYIAEYRLGRKKK